MIWPPLILAGAIVFLLNPVVTRLQGAPHPARPRHRARLPRRGRHQVFVVLLVAPLATPSTTSSPRSGPSSARTSRTTSTTSPSAPRRTMADPDPHLAGVRGPVRRRGRRDTNGEAWSATRRSRTASRRRSPRPASWPSRSSTSGSSSCSAPIIAFYLLVDLPHLRRVFRSLCPSGPAATRWCVSRRLNRDRRLLPRPAGGGVRRRRDGVDRPAHHRPAVLAARRHDRRPVQHDPAHRPVGRRRARHRHRPHHRRRDRARRSGSRS